MSETTLVLLKPDCLADHHAGNVIKRFEEADLDIVGCKMMFLPDQILADHYAHILDRPFYPELKRLRAETEQNARNLPLV